MDADLWTYLRDGKPVGPISREQLSELLVDRTLSPDSMIRQEGTEVWKSVRLALPGLVPPRGAAGQQELHSGAADLGPRAEASDGTHPWRRYLARMLDTMVNAVVVGFPVSVLLSIASPAAFAQFYWLSDHMGKFADGLYLCLFALPLNAVLIGLTGGSLGKWLFGVRILDVSGKPMGIPRAFRRELQLWMRGFAFGLPVIVAFTQIFAYRQLKDRGWVSWDRQLSVEPRFRPADTRQRVLAGLGFVLLAALYGGVAWFE